MSIAEHGRHESPVSDSVPLTSPTPSHPSSAQSRPRWRIAACAATAVMVSAARFVGLDDAPGEWYGDISTVYEYVVNLRNGTGPNGFYSLGTGVLYPQVIRPVLWALGDSYLSIKIAAALCSLIGLLVLFLFARRLVDEKFALLVTSMAGLSSWWLVYSRLGDLQALTPTLSLGAIATAFVVVRRRGGVLWPMICGLLSGFGLYLYGTTVILPVITGLVMVTAWRLGRITVRTVGVWAAAIVLASAPMLDDFIRYPEAFAHGHIGERMVTGWKFFPNLAQGIGRSLLAYVSEGDRVFRGNPMTQPHIDHLSLAFGVIGIVHWLHPQRRRRGIFLLGSFALLHVPALLASVDDLPSASRTVAAAPLAYLFVASGVWWVGRLFRRLGDREAVVAMMSMVVCVGAFNIYVYVASYLPGLPYRNVPIARSIADYADTLPDEVTVHLVGTGWAPGFMPEIKSVVYAVKRPDNIIQDDQTKFDCSALDTLRRPAVLIWTFDAPWPGIDLNACSAELTDVVTSHRDGVPVFRSALLVLKSSDPTR